MLNRDAISALILLGVCAYSWFYQVQKLPSLSKIFPQVCLAALASLSFILLVQGLRKTYEKGMFEGVRLTFVKFMVAAIGVYLMLIQYLGFFVASFFFIMVSGLVFDAERTKKTFLQSILVSTSAAIIFYLVFQKVFSVPFPKGVFWS